MFLKPCLPILLLKFQSLIPPILAVDGSDVILPRNRSDKTTSFQTGPHHTPYNLIHINALYNLEQEIYHDLRIQDNREVDERAALIDMMESCPF